MAKELEHLLYVQRLRELEKRRYRGDLFYIYKYLKGECKEVGARLFSVVPNTTTRGSGHKLEP